MRKKIARAARTYRHQAQRDPTKSGQWILATARLLDGGFRVLTVVDQFPRDRLLLRADNYEPLERDVNFARRKPSAGRGERPSAKTGAFTRQWPMNFLQSE